MEVSKKNLLIIWIFGLISGFTLMIGSYSLNYRLSVEKVDIKTIGMFSLASLPYAINFMWAPIFDTKKFPILTKYLGTKLSWLLATQLCLCLSIYLISEVNPKTQLTYFAIYGFMISFFASTQDSILGALRTETVTKDKQGEISGIYIFGYRIGMLISSSGAVYISQFINWDIIYKLFAIITLTFALLLTILLREYRFRFEDNYHLPTKNPSRIKRFQSFPKFILEILKPVGTTKFIFTAIVFLILYRLPDNFINMMITPFLHHIGYDDFEIATAGKLFGALSAMVGGLIAGYIMKKKPLYYSLLFFGIIHALAHILYIYQELYGKNIYILYLITGFEGTTGGMCMAAYFAFIATLCGGKFKATQYSFFSAMMGLSRSFFPAVSGYIVAMFDWSVFFLFTTIAVIPALIAIKFLEKIKPNLNSI